MRRPIAVTSCLCPLLVFLWFVSQGCRGTQVRPNSVPPPSPSRETLRSQSRLDTMSYLVESTTNPPSLVPQEARTSNRVARRTLSRPQTPGPGPVTRSVRDTELSSPKPRPKVQSNPKTNSVRVQRNDTKLPETDQDPQRPKRGWVRNQFLVLEEHVGPEDRLDTMSYLVESTTNPPSLVPQETRTSNRVARQTLSRPQTPAPGPVTRSVRDTKLSSPNGPKRGWVRNQFLVLEEHVGPEPQYVGKLHSNSDQGDGSVRYILSGEGAGSIFIIDETTGDIHAARTVDRETKSQYVLHAEAIDWRSNRSLEAESEFIVKVQDVNDNAPTFPERLYSATVPEMSDVGTSVFQVTALDADDPTYGNSAKIVYSILEGRPYFSIDPKSGIIRTAVSNLDRETQDHYGVVVQAKDMVGSVGGLSGSTTVNVSLTDVNDNPPRFRQRNYQIYVPEVAPVGVSVGRVRASDHDLGRNAEMIYGITDTSAAAVFSITAEGVVSLKKPLDYEKRKVHTLNVEVSNRHPDPHFSHLGPFKDSTNLRVIVGDVDEPPVFSADRYHMDVYENSPAGTPVGTVTAVDPDSTKSAVRFSMENQGDGPSYFSVGVDSGVVRTTRVLDREDTAWHNVTVMAAEVDNPGLVSFVPVTVQVLDVNDNVPTVAGGNGDVIVCDTTRRGQVVRTLRASDLDAFANGRFTFSVPAGLPVNPNYTLKDNGDNTASMVSTRRPLRDSVSLVVVTVCDGGEPPLSSTATVTVRVCTCRTPPAAGGRHGNAVRTPPAGGRHGNPVCQAEHFLSASGLGTAALVAVAGAVLVAVATLFVLLGNKKWARERLVASGGDVRENVVAYDDEGGGEEDTDAFDLAALRHPQTTTQTTTQTQTQTKTQTTSQTQTQTVLDLDYGPDRDRRGAYGQEVDYGPDRDRRGVYGQEVDYGPDRDRHGAYGQEVDYGPDRDRRGAYGQEVDYGSPEDSWFVLDCGPRDFGRPLVQDQDPRDIGRPLVQDLKVVQDRESRDFGRSLVQDHDLGDFGRPLVQDLKVVQDCGLGDFGRPLVQDLKVVQDRKSRDFGRSLVQDGESRDFGGPLVQDCGLGDFGGPLVQDCGLGDFGCPLVQDLKVVQDCGLGDFGRPLVQDLKVVQDRKSRDFGRSLVQDCGPGDFGGPLVQQVQDLKVVQDYDPWDFRRPLVQDCGLGDFRGPLVQDRDVGDFGWPLVQDRGLGDFRGPLVQDRESRDFGRPLVQDRGLGDFGRPLVQDLKVVQDRKSRDFGRPLVQDCGLGDSGRPLVQDRDPRDFGRPLVQQILDLKVVQDHNPWDFRRSLVQDHESRDFGRSLVQDHESRDFGGSLVQDHESRDFGGSLVQDHESRDFRRSLVQDRESRDFGGPLVQQVLDLKVVQDHESRDFRRSLVQDHESRDFGLPLVQDHESRDFGGSLVQDHESRDFRRSLVQDRESRDFRRSLVQRVLDLKVVQADSDSRGPPYDSLQTFAYEGRGSSTGSVSSLGLTDTTPELNYTLLEEPGP